MEKVKIINLPKSAEELRDEQAYHQFYSILIMQRIYQKLPMKLLLIMSIP